MVTIGMNYEVMDGKADVFERHFGNVVESMKGAAGHIRTHLYRQVGPTSAYLVVSEWSDKAGFDAFIGSDAFKKVTTWGMSGILAGRPRHQVYGAEAPISAAAPGGCPAHHATEKVA